MICAHILARFFIKFEQCNKKRTEFGYKPVCSSMLQINYVAKLKDNTCTLI